MTIKVGDTILDGKVVIAEVDTDNKIVSVTFPSIIVPGDHEAVGVTFTPSQTLPGAIAVLTQTYNQIPGHL